MLCWIFGWKRRVVVEYKYLRFRVSDRKLGIINLYIVLRVMGLDEVIRESK